MGTKTHAPPRFTVDAREGTVAGPGGAVRLEPKVMEVLTILSSHSGRVVSRDELLETVWPNVIVTEHTLSRCIYQLRHELGKIGGEPGRADYNPIETLPKRGYRLLANIETLSAEFSSAPRAHISEVPAIPFVVGQWVRGDRFYGREAQIEEIFEGHRNCIWLLGTRRIGKTSLLKQLEHIAETSRGRRYFPIFWDFQGAETADELHLNFGDALLDADERLERIGLDIKEVEAEDLFVSLERLRRGLRARKLRLLLLCDEVEELIKLHKQDPALLRKLRHAMQSREDIRTVLASTIRLWALADEKEDTSPFLHGFTPPLYIERFSNEEASALIEQSHLVGAERPRFAEGVVEAIRGHCDNHPYLVQLVCKRYLETGRLEEAIEQVATDRMVSYFFSVDFGMLSDAEGNIIQMIARQSVVTSNSIREEISLGPDALEGTLRRLENLGFIRSNTEREFVLANYFFRRWLREMQDDTTPADTPALPVVATANEDLVLHAVAERSTGGLFAELKRRNVFRVGIVYAVVAWVLLQIGEIVFGFLEVPTWAGKLLIVFLALGLPVALVLAWAFELTPEGVKRESDIDHSETATRRSGRKLDLIIIAILAMAVVFFVVDKFFWTSG
ncbi:MAG: winged helix-turn-helix domain-containing protein [Gammaproteobacteria bacterium]|nr:winged helix-turn-helix domain-containing protein [Gammaproteobacteria bacterium]